MSNKSILHFDGGAFLVRDNCKGGELNEIGWAYIRIHSMQLIEIGHIENTVTTLTKREYPLKYIKLKQQIRPDQLEFVSIMCRRGFNTNYAYNFSQKSTYVDCAEHFFNNL